MVRGALLTSIRQPCRSTSPSSLLEPLVLFDPGGDEAAGSVPGHEKGQGEPHGCPDHDVDGSEDRAEGEASQQRERGAGEKGYGRDGVARDKDQRGGGAETFYEVAEAAEVVRTDQARKPGSTHDGYEGYQSGPEYREPYEAVLPQPNMSGTVVSTSTFNT